MFLENAPTQVQRQPDPSRLLRLLALGAALAALGYLPFALTANLMGATRTQFLAMPGIGLELAAAIGLLTAPLPRRSRHAAMALLGA